MIMSVFICREPSLDYYDTVKKFIEKMMEQSIVTKLLMNARKSNSSMLNIGQWKMNITSGKKWRRKKGFNIA